MAPTKHVIKNYIVTETDGRGPPGDPNDRDDSSDEEYQPDDGSNNNATARLRSSPRAPSSRNQPVVVSQRSVDDARPIGESSGAPRGRYFAAKSSAKSSKASVVAEKTLDFHSDNSELDESHDASASEDSWSHSEESHGTSSSSRENSVEETRQGRLTEEALLRRFARKSGPDWFID